MPGKLKEDRRALDQDSAVEAAFVAGSLPEDDRRTPAVESTVEPAAIVEAPVVPPTVELAVPLALNVVKDRGDGVKVDAGGHIITPG